MNNTLNTNTYSSFIFITITMVSFIIDVVQFFVLSDQIIPLTLGLYCCALIYHSTIKQLTCITFLECLKFFCFYNAPFLPLLYCIPGAIATFLFKKNFYPSYFYNILLPLLCTVLTIYCIEGYFLHIERTIYCTIIKIIGTLLSTACFSLTIKYWGIVDNRA